MVTTLVILGLFAFAVAVMADDGFNGTTLNFGGNLSKLRSLSYSAAGNEADVSSLDDSAMKYVAGIPDIEISAEVVGVPTQDVGDTGTTVITWNDGSTEGSTSNTMLVTSRETSGDMNGEITTSLTLKTYGGS